MASLILFEPENLSPYGPMTLLRSVGELRYGIYSNLKRTQWLLPDYDDMQLWVRPILAADHQQRYPELGINKDAHKNTLFLNASIPAWLFPKAIAQLENTDNAVLLKNGVIIAAKSKNKIVFSSDFHKELLKLQVIEASDSFNGIPIWIWDYLDVIRTAVEFDLKHWEKENQYLQKFNSGISTLGEKHIFVHNTAQISNFVQLDASKGPIIIDADCKVSPFCTLQGPLYLGGRSSIKPSTSIQHTIVGNVCNLGGEIKGSIIHPYSNKSHSGYLGDSILGSWVNLGAGTNISNLKNNYHSIRVSWDGNNYDSKRQFLGSVIGDHSKTAIGVGLNTGTFIGPFSNIFQTDFPPRAIPSFSWGNGIHELDKAIETAEIVLKRRGHELSAEKKIAIRELAHDITPFTHF